jgi:hypothetical protein
MVSTNGLGETPSDVVSPLFLVLLSLAVHLLVFLGVGSEKSDSMRLAASLRGKILLGTAGHIGLEDPYQQGGGCDCYAVVSDSRHEMPDADMLRHLVQLSDRVHHTQISSDDASRLLSGTIPRFPHANSYHFAWRFHQRACFT